MVGDENFAYLPKLSFIFWLLFHSSLVTSLASKALNIPRHTDWFALPFEA